MINKKTDNKLKLLSNPSFAEAGYEKIQQLILSGSISPGGYISVNRPASRRVPRRMTTPEAIEKLLRR